MSNDLVSFNAGPWPTDPAKQSIYIEQLMSSLGQMQNYVDSRTADIILLEQSTEPTQEEWEMAWLSQTGKTMPVSKGAVFYWWDTTYNLLAGCYGVLLDDTAVVRKDPKYVRSGIVIKEETSLSVAVSTDVPIGVDNSNHPAVTFTCNQTIQLELVYELWVQLNTGTGAWGADFLLDGVKQGTTIYSIAADQGIFATSASGLIRAFITIENVEAGEHTVQAILGTIGSDATPPTIDYGGIENAVDNFGLRTLSVKGYAL